MKLSKSQREAVRIMFDGLCAYCGCPLGERWHADHVKPVRRELKLVRDEARRVSRLVPTGTLERPENDHIGNIMPACAPCNIDKHAMPLEYWRRKLEDSAGVMQRNHATYRHALRFGLIEEKPAKVVFHFERAAASIGKTMESTSKGGN